jgi:hypothetical protein
MASGEKASASAPNVAIAADRPASASCGIACSAAVSVLARSVATGVDLKAAAIADVTLEKSVSMVERMLGMGRFQGGGIVQGRAAERPRNGGWGACEHDGEAHLSPPLRRAHADEQEQDAGREVEERENRHQRVSRLTNLPPIPRGGSRNTTRGGLRA